MYVSLFRVSRHRSPEGRGPNDVSDSVYSVTGYVKKPLTFNTFHLSEVGRVSQCVGFVVDVNVHLKCLLSLGRRPVKVRKVESH